MSKEKKINILCSRYCGNRCSSTQMYCILLDKLALNLNYVMFLVTFSWTIKFFSSHRANMLVAWHQLGADVSPNICLSVRHQTLPQSVASLFRKTTFTSAHRYTHGAVGSVNTLGCVCVCAAAAEAFHHCQRRLSKPPLSAAAGDAEFGTRWKRL